MFTRFSAITSFANCLIFLLMPHDKILFTLPSSDFNSTKMLPYSKDYKKYKLSIRKE